MAATPSLLDILGHTGPVVGVVLLILLGFSMMTWTIIIYKFLLFRGAQASTRKFLEVFWASRSLDSIFTESKKFAVSPVSRLFQSGYAELQKLVEFKKFQDAKKTSKPVEEGDWRFELSGWDNLERALKRSSNQESVRLENFIPFLATVASTAPFVGLFGTVWGILRSFQGIGASGSASLAVVAPGIAEALIATAVGLAAAIPAAMAYNYFLVRLRHSRGEMENFSSDFLNIIKRNFFTA